MKKIHTEKKKRFNSVNRLLIILLTSVSAQFMFVPDVFSQELTTLKLSNTEIKNVFKAIEKQTTYRFFYTDDLDDINKRINIDVENSNIENLLSRVLTNTKLGYKINENNIIVIAPKEALQHQDKISGIIVDNLNEPIIGANVSVEGTTNGTITDIDGKFTLSNVPGDAVLKVSYIGYDTQMIPVAGKTTFNIILKEDIQALSEVVVVGYGTVKKSNVVGSVGNLKADAIESRPITRVEQALQGQIAGVSVRNKSGSPGSDITISVRGNASINGDSSPLYVVDGVPIDNLSGINPNDIESIDILKDAASAAIYGSRGSNGVVLVTTKKGKTGVPVITLSAYAAASTVEKKVDIMTSDEWVTFNKKWYDRQWVNTSGLSTSASQTDRIAYAEQQNNRTYTTRDELNSIRNQYGIYDPWWGTDNIEAIDWQDELFRTAPSYDIQLNASGATEKVSYSVSGGVFSQEGIVHGSSYDRYTLRANIDAQMTDRLRIGVTVAPSYGLRQGTNVDGKDNAVSLALGMTPWTLKGAGRNAGADPYKFYGEWGQGPNNVSPYIKATAPTRKIADTRNNTSLVATLNIIEGLNIQGMAAWNFRSNSERQYSPTWASATWNTSTPGERSSSSYYTLMSHTLLFQGLATYNRTFGIHSVDAILGASQESYTQTTSYQKQSNFANDKTWVFTKDSGATTDNNEIGYSENALLSYFGRIQYGLYDRYLMTVSLRRDGSSKFGSDNRWGFFPSVAGAWKINEEAFVSDLDWLGTAKLRLSWGQAGNDRIGTAQFLSNMAALNYVTGEDQVLTNGYVVSTIANSLLGWETTTSYNVGLDFGTFNNRAYLSVDYYKKKTKDLLLSAPVSLITGFSSMMDNVGSVENWGMEFELNTANISTPRFTWSSSLNVSFNRNKITSLGSDDSDIRTGQGSTVIQRVGHPINSYMLLRAERTLRAGDFEADGTTPKSGIAIYTGQKPGDTKWTDINGDGVITSADYDVAGNYEPNFEWGFTNNFKYKNFDASVFLQGRVGGDLLSIGSRSWNRGTNAPQWNYMSSWLHDAYWSEEEPGNGKKPGFFSTVTSGQYDTNWMYDASYIRIKNITLGYTVLLKPGSVISRARIYASCDNIYMWDKFDPGYSPEGATQDNASSEWGAYPQARTFSLGVNITF